MCQEQIGKEAQQWEWRQMNGVKMLASILSFQFTDVLKADNFQDTCIWVQAARGEPIPVGAWGHVCVFHSVLAQPPLYKSSLLVIAEATASCQRKPLWPACSSALCPCYGCDCSGFFSLAPTMLFLWAVSGPSLSWKGNVRSHLLSQIRLNESKASWLQEVCRKLSAVPWSLFKRHLPSHWGKK